MNGLIGRTVGPYNIFEQIGQGGMSSVFLAVHREYDRQVAIKILSPYLAHDPQFKARFEREIKLLRQLQHPHIIPILDFGEADGLTYIVMPYISTGTLHERLTQGPLDPRQGGEIIDQLASALAFAHDHGVIHRDVKPSNVLLDEQGNALLSDFSVARPQDATQNLTGSALIGTPAYMSPEQVRGEVVDARSDQYAFAVLLYQITTGMLPFEGETPMAVAMKHVSTPLPRPREVNPHLPEGVELVLIRGLAKDPSLRFDSVEKLNRAFQTQLAAAMDPAHSAAEAQTLPAERTLALYQRYQNVRPPARKRSRHQSEVVAALLLLLACVLSAGAIAVIYPETFRPAIAAPMATALPTQDIQATVDALLTANAPKAGAVVDADATGTAVYLSVLQTLQASLTPVFGSDEVIPLADTVTPEPSLPSSTPAMEEPTATDQPTATRTKTLPPQATPPTATNTLSPASQTPTSTGAAPSATATSTAPNQPTSPPPTQTAPPPTMTSSPVPPTNTQPPPTATASATCQWDEGGVNVNNDVVSLRVYNRGGLPVIVTEVSITWTGDENLQSIRWRFNTPFWTGNDNGPTVSAGTNYSVPVGSYRTVEFEFWGSNFSGTASVSVEAGC